jgi:hypothetical protein
MENFNHSSSINLDHTHTTTNLMENFNHSSSINLDHTHIINIIINHITDHNNFHIQ